MSEKYTKKALKEMDETTLFGLAKSHGFEGDQDDATSDQLVDHIFESQKAQAAAAKQDELAEKGELPTEKVVRGRKNYPGFSGNRKRIIVAEGQRHEQKYAFVGINGDYEAQIPRGIEVSVPEEVVENLTTGAVITMYETDEDGRATGETRKVPRYPVTVLGDA